MSFSVVEQINKRLADLYGSFYDQPTFRVVWSTDQREKRLGTFEDYFGPIFLRKVTEVREVLKYPTNADRWILERRLVNPHRQELVLDNLSYEPVFVFEGSGGPLQPTWRAVNYLCHKALFGFKPKSASDLAEAEAKEEEAERLWFYEYFNNEYPEMASALVHGEGVSVPHKQFGDINGSEHGSLIVPPGNSAI